MTLRPSDYLIPLNAGRQGWEDGQNRFDQMTRLRAGNALSRGDATGGTNALYKGGLLDDAYRFQDQQFQQDTRKKAQADAERKEQLDLTGKVIDGLGRVTEAGQDPVAAFDSVAHVFEAMEPDPARKPQVRQQLMQIREALGKDPKATLAMLRDTTKKAIEQFTLAPGSARYDASGRQIASQPFAPNYQKVGPGDTVMEMNPQGGASAPADGGGDWLAGVSAAAPDAQVTSGYRTAEHNRAVGGVPNSRHLSGEAVDLVPRPGETVAQLYARVRNVPGVKAINEGDHVHVQRAGGTQGGARVVAQGSPKPTARPATPEEKAAYGIPADVPAQMKPDGSVDVISGVGARNKQVPVKIQQGFIENNANITQIDQAIAALKGNPGAMGLWNNLGDEVRQRTDPGGIKVRAAVANVGAVKIHDLSGAAVTAAETPRLKPFIPMPTDTANAAIKKLEQLKEQIQNNNAQIEVQYGPESGYQLVTGGRSAAVQPPPPPGGPAPSRPTAPKPGMVIKGYRFKGGDPSNRASWVKV